MGVTLEQLLNDDVGVEKTASVDAPPVETDLVDALRKHAEDDNIAIREQAAQELTEKTAEIVVIQKALEEIDKVASLGVASDKQKKLATFIKVALDKGHSEQEIADFLQKEAVIGTLGALATGAGGAVLAGKGLKAAGKGIAKWRKARKLKGMEKRLMKRRSKQEALAGKSSKLLEESLVDVRSNINNPSFMSRAESIYGPASVKDVLTKLHDQGTKVPQSLIKKYGLEGGKTSIPSATATTTAPKGRDVWTPWGKKYTISDEAIKKYGPGAGIGAGSLAAGYAMRGGGKKDSKGKNGVVVVNR